MRILILLFALSGSLWATHNIENLRVVWSVDPQHKAMIVWDSEQASEDDYVELSEGDKSQKLKFKAEATIAYGEEGHENLSYYFRHVPVSGLKADTTYTIIAHTGDEVSQEFYFKTAPKDGKPFTLIFAGDSRSDIATTETMSDNIALIAKKDDVLALMHGGDYAAMPHLEYWIPWLKAYSRTTGSDGKLLPIIPVCGNHEDWRSSPLFGQAYGFPGGEGLLYYSCQLSSMVQLIVLNTETTAAGDQKEFLMQSLQNSLAQKVPWQICAYHQPIYPAVKQPVAAKTVWAPIFDKYRIDFSLESDGHCIKRTLPIKNDRPDPDGVVYLGEGGYGAPQRTPQEKWYLKSPGFMSKGPHVMLFHFSAQSVSYETVDPKGQVLDQATFKAKQRP